MIKALIEVILKIDGCWLEPWMTKKPEILEFFQIFNLKKRKF